ncbi:MAG TPA: CpsB/CapC family capsule biosynthesis tyrosine phosphatase [Gemmatimonadaceae bacterium]|nr:CpsB/CapC family capsule biosynthesis tyrosine phosphatase [Gemmatimonadaceae bacterium]
MIDIHSHLLPGVDDGSPSVEVSVPVLERFGAEGVKLLVCTPHLRASEAHTMSPDIYDDIFEQLVAAAPPRPELALGWEIMLDGPGFDLKSSHLHLANSTAVLVEFPRHGIPRGATEELARLTREGMVPIVAHPERYYGCTPAVVREWRSVGAAIQMDAAMLVGRGPIASLAREIIGEGLADCVASDNHGDRRSLGAAAQWLRELGAEDHARLLTEVNPGRLLAGERPLPVPHISSLERGAFARLRELIFGRK